MAATCIDPGQQSFWQSGDTVVFANPRDPAAVTAANLAREALTEPSASGGGLIHFLTSGSTGHPKIVGFTRDALLASARAVNAFLRVTPDDVWLRVLPVFHVGGFQVGARAWTAGARCVARDEPWDPAGFTRQCEDCGVTRVSLVPTQVHDVVQAGHPAPASLRTVLVGGGELHPVLHDRARTLGWPVRASYGLTEAASTVAIQADNEPSCTRLTILPHWEADLAADGTLLLRGPSLPRCLGSWDRGSGRYHWKDFTPPLATRDRVRLDRRSLVFAGRADRVIKRLGELVDLAEAERVLADVALAAGVYGRVFLSVEPDPRDEHRLVLECLNLAEGETAAARFDAVQPAFARISELRVVDSLRLSPLGKPIGSAPSN